MSWLFRLAASSAWNRRFALSLVLTSVALSTFLLLGVERIRADVRGSFAQSVAGTDLIVGARTGSIQLLLYSVFRIGNASSNIRWTSAQAIAAHPAVAWTIPISLGDSHRGFPVVATVPGYFQNFRHGSAQSLVIAQGQPFAALFDAVLGAEVARRLGYRLGDRIVLSHGDGLMPDNDHAGMPFTIVGMLAPTGTPVDRSVHIGLDAMEAIHLDGGVGAPLRGAVVSADEASRHDLTPRNITAVLVGLKSRVSVFSTQRWVSEFAGEPLMAVLPGVALDELWDLVGVGERGLAVVSALVAAVSLAGLVATIMAGLGERRRELAVLRALGASSGQVLALLAAEGVLVTVGGVLLGAATCALAITALRDWIQAQFAITLSLGAHGAGEFALLGAVLTGGCLASLVPGYRAYRLSMRERTNSTTLPTRTRRLGARPNEIPDPNQNA